MREGELLIRSKIIIDELLKKWESDGNDSLLAEHKDWIEKTKNHRPFETMLCHMSKVLSANYVGLSGMNILSHYGDENPVTWVRHGPYSKSWTDSIKSVDMKVARRGYSANIFGFVISKVFRHKKRTYHEGVIYYLHNNDYTRGYSPLPGHDVYPSEMVPWSLIREQIHQLKLQGRIFANRTRDTMDTSIPPTPSDRILYSIYMDDEPILANEGDREAIAQLVENDTLKEQNGTLIINEEWLEQVLEDIVVPRPRRVSKPIPVEAPTRTRKRRRRRGTSRLQSERSYIRETKAKRQKILRLHNKLVNLFQAWLTDNGAKEIEFEKDYVDVSFVANGITSIAELKVVGGLTTTDAIREALGQLLEYNHYDDQVSAEKWLIVLDEEPSREDVDFIQCLREKYGLPLHILSVTDGGFKVHIEA